MTEIILDDTPSGEEEQAAFASPEGYRKHLDNKSFKQDIEERKAFAAKAYCITQTWIGLLIVITIAQFVCKKNRNRAVRARI